MEQKPDENPQRSDVSKTAFMLMLVIVVGLLTLAIFANVQKHRHGDVETVVVKPATSSPPSTQQH